MPDEGEGTFVNAIIASGGDKLWEVIDLAFTINITQITHKCFVASVRISQACIALIVDDFVAAEFCIANWIHILNHAAEVLEHAIVVHLVEVLDWVQVMAAIIRAEVSVAV